MLVILLVVLTLIVATQGDENVTNVPQLLAFKEETEVPIGILTTSAGAQVLTGYTDSVNTNLLDNEFFLDSLTHITRERIPERVVHAQGSGAHGEFRVTHDISEICKAKLFDTVGKTTPVFVRFSLNFIEHGGYETSRETRGLAIKFYTEEGNFDLLTLNVKTFPVKDPLYFSGLIHSMKRNPQTNQYMDPNMVWDFITLRPENFRTNIVIFSDRGIPDGYRHMPGYGIQTFEVVNYKEEKTYVRFHVIPQAGIKGLTADEAAQKQAQDPYFATSDLYNAIDRGDFPKWTIYIQIASLQDVETSEQNLFDVTLSWPEDMWPLHEIGELILNRNPINYFAEVEQAAFCPSNLVPGINGGVDNIFKARKLLYRDTQNYRLGVNFQKIAINTPYRVKTLTYNRNGRPPVKDNELNAPNVFPNSFNGPFPRRGKAAELPTVYIDPLPTNLNQTGEVYELMSEDERNTTVDNIVSSLSKAVEFLQIRAVKLFYVINPDLGSRVSSGLGLNYNFTNIDIETTTVTNIN